MIRLAAALAALSLALLPPQTAPPARMRLGEVLHFTVPDVEPGADPKAFEPLLRTLASEMSAPGAAVHLFRADRGSRKGQYAVVRTVDTLKRQREGAAIAAGSLNGGIEYHLVAPEKVGALPEVDVLGLHYTQVRPDRIEAFERFVRAQLHPALGNLRPDLRVLYYKAVRGAEAGRYIALFALTRASRDKYWPGGADSDDLRAAFKPVQGLTPELGSYLVEGSYLADPKFAAAVFESRDWTDFVLVSPAAR